MPTVSPTAWASIPTRTGVLPPHVVYRTSRLDETGFDRLKSELGQRLDDLPVTPPIPFRRQNAGQYDIPALTLRSDIETGRHGFGVHVDAGGSLLPAV